MSPSSQNLEERVRDDATLPAWKLELNERLAANRSRRLQKAAEQVPLPGLEHISQKIDSRAARLAAKVAQRYANAPSYSEMMAKPQLTAAPESPAASSAEAPAAALPVPAPAAEIPAPVADWDVPWEMESAAEPVAYDPGYHVEEVFHEEEPAETTVEPLPANLIEIPRELVAARKMRPRLAEGPLWSAEDTSSKERAQFNIFELAPETVSHTASVGSSALEWAPIRLEAHKAAAEPHTMDSAELLLKTASLADRLMAGIFDTALVLAAFAVFVLVFVACTTHPPTGKAAIFGAGAALLGFWLLYQYLFFRFAEGTPGMRYARIALCTFDDENPSRKAMCRRVFLVLVSAAPAGMGFIWALVDADRLSWHDRLSRTYQRSYS